MRPVLWFSSCVLCAVLGFAAGRWQPENPAVTDVPTATVPETAAAVEPVISAPAQAERAESAPAQPSEERPAYRLVGIIGTGPDSATLYALIEAPEAGIKRYRENAELPGGAILSEISPRSVRLLIKGESVELRLQNEDPERQQRPPPLFTRDPSAPPVPVRDEESLSESPE